MLLLSVTLVLTLLFGQRTEAAAGGHHPEMADQVSVAADPDSLPETACHPGLACAACILPDGGDVMLSAANVVALQPDMAQTQRRFGGPSVTIPPPRSLA